MRKKGATALKLVGDIVPVDKVEVIKKVKENLLKEYPLTARELIDGIKVKIPECKESKIYEMCKAVKLKDDLEYSAYNFRSRKHEDEFKSSGKLPNGTPSIYKQKAVDYISQLITNEK